MSCFCVGTHARTHTHTHIHTQIFEYICAKEDFISLFLAHLGTSAMMDLLLQMVAAPDNDQCRMDLAVVCEAAIDY